MSLPTTNEEVLNSPEESKDRFFLLGELLPTEDGCKITVDADGSCVAIEAKDQQEIQESTGITLPLRKNWDKPDTRAQYNMPDNMRMIGAGGIVSYQIGDEEPRTVLFEKTGGPSKGRMAQASGLSDGNPLTTMWSEITEETGMLLVDREAQKLLLVVPQPEDGVVDPAFTNAAEQERFFTHMEQTKLGQVDNIHAQLPEDVKNWEIQTIRVESRLSPEDEPYAGEVMVMLPGRDPLVTHAIIADSDQTANVNLLRPVRIDLPEGTEVICVDPESFQRPVQTFTREEMLTPDFIENKSSVPMRPYLSAAYKMEVKNEHTPAADAENDGQDLSL